MVALGWLGASIVHDLRNPLGTIRSGSEILTDAAFNSAQVKRVARNIHHAAVRMEKLLNDLMASVRGNVTPPELCGLRDVIVSASEIVWAGGQHENVRLSLSEVPPDIHLPLRRSSMERTFVSLLVNSCEAMPQGGAIGIRAQRTERHVFIEVHDSGPGIPDSIRDILFKPFVTAGKPTGMGLGLALARQTILYHGGDIWLEPGAGARFAMRLPLDQSRPQPGPNGLALSAQQQNTALKTPRR
jgi:signal transduction histidine kinase